MSRLTVFLSTAFVLVLVVFDFSPRQASANEAVTKIMLHGTGMITRHEDRLLRASAVQREPDMLAEGVRLGDDGYLLGGGLSGSFMVDRTRLGIGVTFFGVGGTRILHGPLPEGYEMKGGRLWGETLDLRLGREFQLGPLFPYVDLRVSFTIMAVSTGLQEERLGHVGSTQYNRFSLGLGPVAGLFLPISNELFLDFAGYGGLIGDEKMGGTVGIGAWFGL